MDVGVDLIVDVDYVDVDVVYVGVDVDVVYVGVDVDVVYVDVGVDVVYVDVGVDLDVSVGVDVLLRVYVLGIFRLPYIKFFSSASYFYYYTLSVAITILHH